MLATQIPLIVKYLDSYMDSLRSSGQVEAMETQNDDSHRRKSENLMRLIESSCPSLRLPKKEIERQFSKIMRTPDHPPYASMIQNAITELNELGGSSEEAISKFIVAEYEDLPFAHANLLTHHLQKLVKKVDIVCTSENCYILTNESSELKKEQKHLRRRCQEGRKNGRQHKVKGVKSQKQKKIEKIQEETQVNGTICKGIEEQKPAEGHIGPTGEQENKGDAELIEKHNEVEEIQFKVNDEQVEAEQYNEGNEEHNQKQEQQKQQLNLNLLGSLHLTKEEQLLKKTNMVRGKLIDSLNLEVLENSESKPIMGGQRELLEEHVLHLNPCKGQPQEEQQLEACGKLKVSEQQPKTTPASEKVPTDLMQLEQKTQIELPTLRRIGDVLSQMNIPTTESHKKFSGEANIFKPKVGQSYLVGFIENLHKSRRAVEHQLQAQRQMPSDSEPQRQMPSDSQ